MNHHKESTALPQKEPTPRNESKMTHTDRNSSAPTGSSDPCDERSERESIWTRLLSDNCGATAVEYGIAVAALSAILVLMTSSMSAKVGAFFANHERLLVADTEGMTSGANSGGGSTSGSGDDRDDDDRDDDDLDDDDSGSGNGNGKGKGKGKGNFDKDD